MTGPDSGLPERHEPESPNSVGDAYHRRAVPLARQILAHTSGRPQSLHGVTGLALFDFLSGPVQQVRHLLTDLPALVITGAATRADWLHLTGAVEELLADCKHFTPPDGDKVVEAPRE
ncbi:MAG TPA: hypothetical protein VFX53_04485 [Pedococcus sp.]|nr:hypothetical protein [Pedococcus sp.]